MFYTIENRTDKEVGNIFPQVNCLSLMHAHQLNHKNFPTFKPDLKFELESKAKLTDVLSQGAINANGLLINSKVRSIFEKHNLMQHKYFPVNIKDRQNSYEYFWIHLADLSFLENIDYQNSSFFRTEYGFREEDITLKSFEDYKIKKAIYGNMGTIESDILKINKNIINTLDILAFPLFDDNIYISDSLYKELSKSNITGIACSMTNTLTS